MQPKLQKRKTVNVTNLILIYFSQAPLENSNNKHDLAEKFVEFLKQDEQLSGLLQNGKLHEAVRNRRATSMESAEIDTTTLDTADAGGFFDRAAKFVMEVLQRFLRWVNTDE